MYLCIDRLITGSTLVGLDREELGKFGVNACFTCGQSINALKNAMFWQSSRRHQFYQLFQLGWDEEYGIYSKISFVFFVPLVKKIEKVPKGSGMLNSGCAASS